MVVPIVAAGLYCLGGVATGILGAIVYDELTNEQKKKLKEINDTYEYRSRQLEIESQTINGEIDKVKKNTLLIKAQILEAQATLELVTLQANIKSVVGGGGTKK